MKCSCSSTFLVFSLVFIPEDLYYQEQYKIIIVTLAASYICLLLLGLPVTPAPQQTSLPVVKRRNIRASPTRIFFTQSQSNPTVRSVQVPSPSSPLWANAWQVHLATFARCHISSKDSAFQFGLNTRELCSCRWKTGPLAVSALSFSFMFLVVGIFTAEGKK